MTSGLLRVAVVVVSGIVAAGIVAGCAGDESTPTPTMIPNYPPFKEVVYPTPTKAPTASATATKDSSPSVQPTATKAPSSTAQVVASFTATPTETPKRTALSSASVDERRDVTPTDTVVPTDTATPASTPTGLSTPTATNSSEPTAISTFTPTVEPSDTPSPSPTQNPLDEIRFVDNEDCGEGVSRDLLPTIDLVIESGDSSYALLVEVADDGRERQQGLMCRQTVPHGTGMLFVFESARSLNFWMFNTYEPLDIVYLDESRIVVGAVRMEPCPRPDGVEDGAWRSACSAASSGYGSGGSAQYALELPAGWLASVGLELENLEGVVTSW